MKWLVVFLLSFSVAAWQPFPTHEPIIDKEIAQAQQKISAAMGKVSNIQRQMQIIEQQIYEAAPGTNLEKLKELKAKLDTEIAQAKEEARIAKNHLNDLAHQQEDRQTKLSQE